MKLVDVEPIIAKFSGGEELKSIAECVRDEIIVNELRNAPTVDAVPEVHGRWIYCYGYYQCSLCGSEMGTRDGWNYCPNCGAKMDLKEEDHGK